jgi:3-oxoacyl-[acyl-carrier-protein] synthase II
MHLVDAFNYIRLGKAVAFIAGGSEAAITEAGVGGFNAMHAFQHATMIPNRIPSLR